MKIVSHQIQLIQNLHFKIRLFPFFSTLYCWNGKAYESAEIKLGNMDFVKDVRQGKSFQKCTHL